MTKTIFAFGAMMALAMAGQAAAQDAPASDNAAAPASINMKALPKCSATLRDSCDQSATTEKHALSAQQAEASGGVGIPNRSMAASKKPVHHRTKHKTTTKVTTTTSAAPQ